MKEKKKEKDQELVLCYSTEHDTISVTFGEKTYLRRNGKNVKTAILGIEKGVDSPEFISAIEKKEKRDELEVFEIINLIKYYERTFVDDQRSKVAV